MANLVSPGPNTHSAWDWPLDLGQTLYMPILLGIQPIGSGEFFDMGESEPCWLSHIHEVLQNRDQGNTRHIGAQRSAPETHSDKAVSF